MGRHKIDSMQFVPIQRLLREGEMTAMNRIEGTAKESNIHGEQF
jgi:hypothetical protein